MLVSLQLHLWTILQHTGVQCLITNAQKHWFEQNAFLTAQSSFAKQVVNRLVSLQIDLWVIAHHPGVQ